MINEFELSELLIAKFCHDLAGPIGAINNGFEFLKEENSEMRQKAYQLVEISAKQSVARLQFFRYIYGTLPAVGEANLSEVKLLADNYLVGSKVSLNWPNEGMVVPGVSISHRMAQIILNLIHVSSYVLIHGGVVSVEMEKLPNGKRVQVVAKGNQVKQEEETTKILLGQLDGIVISTKNVHIYNVMQKVSAIKARLTCEVAEDQVIYVVELTKE
jgi:histidine phosphotransferase ChpT